MCVRVHPKHPLAGDKAGLSAFQTAGFLFLEEIMVENRLPCYRFYGVREENEERTVQIQYGLLNMLKRSGCPGAEEACLEVFCCTNPALAGAVDTIQCEKIFEEIDPHTPFSCVDYWKDTLGIDVRCMHGNYCLVCMAGETGSGNRFLCEQESRILSYLFHLPYEDGKWFFEGGDPFLSYEDLNRHFNGKLRIPCVIQLSSVIFNCLQGQISLYQKICDSMGNEKRVAAVCEELTEAVLTEVVLLLEKDNVLEEGAKDFLTSTPCKRILSGYITNFYLLCEPSSESQFEIFLSMHGKQRPCPDTEQTITDTEQESGGVDAEQIDAQTESEMDESADEGSFDCGSLQQEEEAPIPIEELKSPGEETGQEVEDESAVPKEAFVDRPIWEHPFFHKKIRITEGGWLTGGEPVEVVRPAARRYLIPFAQNDDNPSIANRNMIVHHELLSACLEGMVDVSDVNKEETFMELAFLTEKVKKDKRVSMEIVYLTDMERYVLLVWNGGTTRYDYVPLMDKKEGLVKVIPIQIIRLLKNEKIKVICYQPYLLCGMMGLYERQIELKNIHSIYSHYKVFAGQRGGGGGHMEDIFNSYLIGANDKMQKEVAIARKRFAEKGFLLVMMPLYATIMRQQFLYAELAGIQGLCASRQRKDIMYGYSYLAAGLFPSMQKARFSLLSSDEIVFCEQPSPAASYEPGYIVEFTFSNIDEEGNSGKIAENVRNNHRARQLLLKELARRIPAFYHTHLKILFFDDYHITFFMTHDYRDENQKLIEQTLYRECTRHHVPSNKLRAAYWATTFNSVRIVSFH